MKPDDFMDESQGGFGAYLWNTILRAEERRLARRMRRYWTRWRVICFKLKFGALYPVPPHWWQRWLRR